MWRYYISLLSISAALLRPNAKACDQTFCENGGRCGATVEGKNRCLCPLGFTGANCTQGLTTYTPMFHGGSYISFSSIGSNIKHDLRIQLNFTSQPSSESSLLLYIGFPKGDFLALKILERFIIFRYELGNGPSEIHQSLGEHKQGDLITTTCSIINGRGSLSVNHQRAATRGPGYTTMLNLRPVNSSLEPDVLHIGGHPSFKAMWKVQAKIGLKGCVYGVSINNRIFSLHHRTYLSGRYMNGYDISDCNTSACRTISCHPDSRCVASSPTDYRCICNIGSTGRSCRESARIEETPHFIPKFTTNSYMRFPTRNHEIADQFNLRMTFKSRSDDGVLFYLGPDSNDSTLSADELESGDYFCVHLYKGHIRAVIDLGGEKIQVRSLTKLSVDEWHTIHIYRQRTYIELTLNSHQSVSSNASSSLYSQLNVRSFTYIGGHDDVDVITLKEGTVVNGFNGCISHIELNGYVYLPKHAVGGANLDLCDHPCFNPFLNDCDRGLCRPDKQHARCDCDLGYTGKLCSKKIGPISMPRFTGNSRLVYTNYQLLSRLNTPVWDIRMNIRPNCTRCVILWAGNPPVLQGRLHGNDFLLISINKRGYLRVEYDIGAGRKSHVYESVDLMDNTMFYRIRLHRNTRYAILKVNQQKVESIPDYPIGYEELNAIGGLVLGSLPEEMHSHNFKPFRGDIQRISIGDVELSRSYLTNEASLGKNIIQAPND